MTQSYESLSSDRAPSTLDGASLPLPCPTLDRESDAPLAAPHVALSRHGTLASIPGAKRSEVATIVVLSVLLHTGAAVAALSSADHRKAPARPLSRVQIQVARPRPTPAVVPPTPPPEARPKPSAQPLARREPLPREPVPVESPAPSAPIDTGSSAPAAEDGTLFAGSGGLGTAAPPAPPPPAPVVAPAAPAPVVQAREGANYSKNPRPPYPGLARRQGWEGTTLLSVQVTPNGKAGAVRVQRSSGRGALDDAALSAVKGWTFVPATQGGLPVAGWVTVPIVFKLQ